MNIKTAVALVVAAAALWVLKLAAPALTPFVFALVTAYVLAPLASFLESLKLPRGAAAGAAALMMLLLFVAAPLMLLPLLLAQLWGVVEWLPQAAAAAEARLAEFAPAIVDRLRELRQMDAVNLWENFAGIVDAQQAKDTAFFAANTAAAIFGKGVSALAAAAGIVLISPLAVFYFIRDREKLGARLAAMLPAARRPQILAAARELDQVMGELLRGQLTVMMLMAVFYALALHLAGLNFALAIGVLTGILSFIPYAGFTVGFVLAMAAAFVQFDSWQPMAMVAALMLAGTTVESLFITPRLIGERIGLGPVAVLFALAVMGQLYGFLGVLIALPAAAALQVVVRHLAALWRQNTPPPPSPPPSL